MSNKMNSSFIISLFVCMLIFVIHLDAEQKVKKDPRDYTDADIDKLEKEWDDNDEEKDEEYEFQRKYPGGRRRPPAFNMNDIQGKKPEEIIKLSKKGQTLMMFVTVSGNPTRQETEEITQIWYLGLKNGLYDVTKYVVDDNRILLLLQDGGDAFDVKDFLVQQERCDEVMIDNRPYYGKGHVPSPPPPPSSTPPPSSDKDL